MADRFDGVEADLQSIRDAGVAVSAALGKIGDDITHLNDQIAALSVNVVTDERIAALQAESSALVASFSAVKDAADALDARTPDAEVPPPVEPPTV